MTTPNDIDSQGTSTRPYLIRALHDWCTDNGFTPYLAVYVDHSVRVPQEYVKNNEIVLNVSVEATSQLQLGNEFVEFKARFGGVSREICVPVDHVIAIYARENGQGMAFPVPSLAEVGDESTSGDLDGEDHPAGDADERAPLHLARTAKASVSSVKDKERGGSGKGLSKLEDKSSRSKATSPVSIVTSESEEPPEMPPPTGGGRPALRRVK
ncbi:MAG: ClpXP protease specificity-enhancing factor [Pseudomonadota bacterium]